MELVSLVPFHDYTFPVLQSFLRRLKIWVNLLNPTLLLSSDVSSSHCSDPILWDEWKIPDVYLVILLPAA